MKILCLHGFRHNSALLQKSMSTLTKKFGKNDITFDFLDSCFPYVCVDGSEVLEKTDLKQWWSAKKDSILKLDTFDTVNESIEHIQKKWDENKYDGILGFSQGSVLAQIFAYRCQNKQINTYSPKFIILCSTFPITDLHECKQYENKLNLPCFIMYGSKDLFVQKDLTLKFSKICENATIYEHNGGHYVSSTKDTCDALLAFFNKLNIV